MNWIKAVGVTFLPRVLGVIASGIAGWVVVHTKGVVTVDPTTLIEVGTTMIAGYAATHRASSSVINPGDAAKGRTASAEKTATQQGGTVRIPAGE